MTKNYSEQNNKQSLLQLNTIGDFAGVELDQSASMQEFSVTARAVCLNRRQGTVACKGRSEVNKTNKKPWKQKGTGRARAGSARSPLWKGGGVIFGPEARTRTNVITRKQNKRVLLSMFFDFVKAGKIGSLDWEPNKERQKTSEAYKILQSSGLGDKKIIFFVSPEDVSLHTSLANIPFVSMFLFDQPNVFDLANSNIWVYLKRDQQQFNTMVERWI